MKHGFSWVLAACVSLLAACGDDGEGGNGVMVTPPAPAVPTPAGAGAPAPPAPPAAMVAGCEVADTTGADLHGAASAVLTAATPCGFSSCHQGNGKAGLVLSGVTDLNATLVGKVACEAPNLMLVNGAGGDAGLAASWLWLKMVAPAVAGGMLTEDPAWGTPGNCGQVPPGSYGARMPAGGSPDTLAEERLAPVRNWICAGAPAP